MTVLPDTRTASANFADVILIESESISSGTPAEGIASALACRSTSIDAASILTDPSFANSPPTMPLSESDPVFSPTFVAAENVARTPASSTENFPLSPLISIFGSDCEPAAIN